MSMREAKFPVGTPVRVKPGVTDPEYPDIPLGGWSGMIEEIVQEDEQTICVVEWNQSTLDQMHPVYVRRCERDNVGFQSMGLPESDLELDTGDPIAMEKPTAIVPRSLSPERQEDRIAAVFKLTSDEPLPRVSQKSIVKYYKSLIKHLRFPFQAHCSQQTGPDHVVSQPFDVVDLSDPADYDTSYGLICEARQGLKRFDFPLYRIEVQGNEAFRQLVEDYGVWFANWS